MSLEQIKEQLKRKPRATKNEPVEVVTTVEIDNDGSDADMDEIMKKLKQAGTGESELSAGTSATRIREKQSPGGYQTTVMSADRSDRPATMVMSMTSARMYLADCRMMMHHRQECHSRLGGRTRPSPQLRAHPTISTVTGAPHNLHSRDVDYTNQEILFNH